MHAVTIDESYQLAVMSDMQHALAQRKAAKAFTAMMAAKALPTCNLRHTACKLLTENCQLQTTQRWQRRQYQPATMQTAT